MACGTPVVTGDNSSLPEAAGKAALLVKAEDIDEIARAMGKVIEDPVLRGRMIKNGYAQATAFTWQRSANALLDAYRLVLRESRR
jgi:glycosyltransferase involved in cell wall biosynthesis